VKLCEPHAAAEQAAFTEEGRLLVSKHAVERMKALNALAALTEAHTNAPSARVAKRIASALDDGDMEVRTYALGLLCRPQHARASLDALVDALARTKREQDTLTADCGSLWGRLLAKSSEKGRAELGVEFWACIERREALGRWRLALLDRLATFPDDRAVEAILEHTHRNLLLGGDEALVQLGSRKAIRALIESFEGCDRNLDVARKKVEAWKAGYRGWRTHGSALSEEALGNLHERYVRVREGLVTRFAEHGLIAPPAMADTAVWCAWIEKNLDVFPERLPGLASPAW
jgi:hypothetical protein